MIHETLLDEFVGYIEDEFATAMTDVAREVVRKPQDGCRGERLCSIAMLASERVGLPAATLLESFGRACASSLCGRELDRDEALGQLAHQLASLAGKDASIASFSQDADRLDVVVHYRDGAGCGDLVAGWLAAWLDAHLSHARLRRFDFSPLPGSHIRFHLTGELN